MNVSPESSQGTAAAAVASLPPTLPSTRNKCGYLKMQAMTDLLLVSFPLGFGEFDFIRASEECLCIRWVLPSIYVFSTAVVFSVHSLDASVKRVTATSGNCNKGLMIGWWSFWMPQRTFLNLLLNRKQRLKNIRWPKHLSISLRVQQLPSLLLRKGNR